MINPELSGIANTTTAPTSHILLTLFLYIIIAAIISVIWNMIAKKEYGYNKHYPKIAGMNSFPLIMWTLGLPTMMIIYDYIESAFALQSFITQLIVFTLSYWILLLIAETIGYHVLKIHNEKTAKYPGIPILNCMHAPTWMKIAYFSHGIIMFLTCKAFAIKGLF